MRRIFFEDETGKRHELGVAYELKAEQSWNTSRMARDIVVGAIGAIVATVITHFALIERTEGAVAQPAIVAPAKDAGSGTMAPKAD